MASISDDRIAHMENAISRIEDSQRLIKWAGGVMVALIIGVVLVNLGRNFTLGDRLSDVRVNLQGVSSELGFVRQNTDEIKGDLKELRKDVGVIRSAVDRISETFWDVPSAKEVPGPPPKKSPPPPEKIEQ